MTGILFDLDGTLLNTLDDLMDAVNHTMEVFGYPRHSREEVRRFVGNGAGRLLRRGCWGAAGRALCCGAAGCCAGAAGRADCPPQE